jgi:uridine kinase
MTTKNDHFLTLLKIILEESKKSSKKPFVMAIDGRGGSGKSSLAKKLKKSLEDSVLIEREKFMNFMKGMDTKSENWNHQDFVIDQKALKQAIFENQQKSVLILEGLKTFELNSDLKIWMQCDTLKADLRGKKRDLVGNVNPTGFAKFWSDYKNYSEEYIESFNPDSKADVVVFTEKEGWEIEVINK